MHTHIHVRDIWIRPMIKEPWIVRFSSLPRLPLLSHWENGACGVYIFVPVNGPSVKLGGSSPLFVRGNFIDVNDPNSVR